MAPAIVDGDHVIVEKTSYRFRPPRRGEIIVFRTDRIENLAAGEYFTFRVVGLPGERVAIDPPYLVIDGRRITAPPIFESIASREAGHNGYLLGERGLLDTAESEVILGEDEYFVLGDNAANSHDSRFFGPVPRKSIIGRVTRIYWPLNRVNALEGKW
jgi:signal peptidase I